MHLNSKNPWHHFLLHLAHPKLCMFENPRIFFLFLKSTYFLCVQIYRVIRIAHRNTNQDGSLLILQGTREICNHIYLIVSLTNLAIFSDDFMIHAVTQKTSVYRMLCWVMYNAITYFSISWTFDYLAMIISQSLVSSHGEQTKQDFSQQKVQSKVDCINIRSVWWPRTSNFRLDWWL